MSRCRPVGRRIRERFLLSQIRRTLETGGTQPGESLSSEQLEFVPIGLPVPVRREAK
jgi:hypothetical protein